MAVDYNKTVNLPKTDFPMRAGLPQREPVMLEKWEEDRLYYRMVENNKGKPIYCFHDGPPYANADIHLGTALNKVLKDFVVRYRNMSGYVTAFVPGWDTHGLPIEQKAIKHVGVHIASDPVVLRKHCHEFAMFHVENQKKQFKRLGTLADYDNPYLTLRPEYEAKQIEVFGEMAKKGYIYKDLKSVYWCPDCVTALAEAEIEYADDACDSIYVKFRVEQDNGTLARMGADPAATDFVIWTTTTWTLPANLAICLGPEFEYVAVKTGNECLIMAKALVESTMLAAGIENYEVLGSATGKELEGITYKHAYLERVSPVIVGDHVTLETGTGCVHTAPGHGVEDFEVCAKFYPEVGCVVPVDDHGKMTAEAGDFVEGQTTAQANMTILKRLQETGHILALIKINHQYPHCWRCREPILFRATEQWFCSVEDFKDETIREIDKVRFVPEWGKQRLTGMVQDRSAWCISRQRTWGVPIPVFYCDDCGEYVINDVSINAVRDLFRAEGSDAWFKKQAAEILPEGFACPKCAGTSFTKETDTMDVWFDSGTSHMSVLGGGWEHQSWPADLYLEGTDQYRGWFQSSLLTGVAAKGAAPYKCVCCHGWVVDGEGKKMSKSLGNGVDPGDIVNEYGSDILRLWVASSDYHADIRISPDILKQMSEVYRKIRNTARYILGNIDGFDPAKDSVDVSALPELDRWAIARLAQLVARVRQSYEDFDFHIVYHAIHNFCTIDMSNFYLDVIKDRLYTEKADGHARRSAQTAIYRILRTLTLLIAPIIPFTAEEIWGFMPEDADYNAEAAVFNEIPAGDVGADDALLEKWDTLIRVRDDVNKALELARAAKAIGKSLEARVTLHCDEVLYDTLNAEISGLADIFIVSGVVLERGGEGAVKADVLGLSLTVSKAPGEKCARCWKQSEDVGEATGHPTICVRCANVVE